MFFFNEVLLHASDVEAIDYARGMVWVEIGVTYRKVSFGDLRFVGEIPENFVSVYYCHITDAYYFVNDIIESCPLQRLLDYMDNGVEFPDAIDRVCRDIPDTCSDSLIEAFDVYCSY